MSEFVNYKEQEIKKCKIDVFDDGNYLIEEKYDNLWLIIATNNKGKVMLRNINDPTFILYSISYWKVREIEEEEYILYSKFIKNN
jgi:hypothetical protein